jgi:hypothetical protein
VGIVDPRAAPREQSLRPIANSAGVEYEESKERNASGNAIRQVTMHPNRVAIKGIRPVGYAIGGTSTRG